MTTHSVVRTPEFTWIDVVSPARLDLLDLARTHGLHPTFVEDCLEPEHLPKYERINDATFLILRVHDDTAPEDAATVQELTRKIAIFFRNDFVLTVHRVELHEVTALRGRYGELGSCSVPVLLAGLINGALSSYEKPLEKSEAALDGFEAALFDDGDNPSLKRAHDLKRRVSLSRRILWQTSNVLNKLTPPAERGDPLFHDIRETVEGYLFWTDQLLEQATLLQQVQLSMASQRTNEVMRVLTIFSAFFLPLTFIVGVYGMNFKHMPELEQQLGYPVVMLGMAAVALVIWIWFKRKGWLGS